MEWHKLNVGKYYDLMLVLREEERFKESFTGAIKPFYPSTDEELMIQELREQSYKRLEHSLDIDLAISISNQKLISEYLETNHKYHYEDYYSKGSFFPISVSTKNEQDRLVIIDNLSEDLGMWDFLNHVNQIKNDIDENRSGNNEGDSNKLKWIATPAVLGHVIQLLVEGGYIEQPTTKGSNDTNYAELGRKVLESFEGNTGKLSTLQKVLNPNTPSENGSLSKDKKEAFVIPKFSFIQSKN